jgi:hypothetical protein
MKNLILLFVTICCISNLTKAQTPCDTKAPSEEWEQWFQTKIAERKANLASGRILQTNYVIPVIVHILHDGDNIGSNENLSASRIQSQIDNLNLDFSGTNQDINNLPTYFQNIKAGNTGIQFCLAKQKPNGNLITEAGIDRININDFGFNNPSTYTNKDNLKAYFKTIIKPQTIWDQNRYLNIWVADILNAGLYGYATFPVGTGLDGINDVNVLETYNTSGIVICFQSFGNNNVSNPPFQVSKKRVATHEIGHWLGLRHLSGDASCAIFGDFCDDTPPNKGGYNGGQDGQNLGCPTDKWNANTCDLLFISKPNGDLFMNYMDYTDDACMYMFSNDQKIRMQTAMQFGTYRNTLANSQVCQTPNKPDLTIINQSATPSNVNAGSNVTLSFVEKNIGGASASPNYVSFHISSNDVLTPGSNGDRFIGEYYVNQTLAANSQTSALNKQVTIPADLATGTYYIFFSADGAETVNESIENNNFATKIINVTNTGGSTCTPTVPTNRTQTPYQTYASLNWSTVSGIESYIIRYKATSSTNWQFEYPTSNSIQISSLNCNTSYEWQVSSKCANGTTSNYSASNTFTTTSCGTVQNNDNCSNAINLVSTTNCNPVNGSVANAFSSNYYIPTCGVYQASPTALDVWYKFIAQATSHTISVDPEGNTNSNEYMDVVIGLYNNQCSESNLIECYDKPSTGIAGGVTSTYTFNGLSVGNTYYIRIYDWGSIPPVYPGFTICVTHQTSSNNNHDFYIQDLNVNSSSFSPNDPLIINASQYTTNPLAPSTNVNMDYTIRTNSGNLIQRVGTDNSTIGNGTTYNAENISTTFPNGSFGSSCLICAESNYDLAVSESNTYNNRSCVSVSIGNSNNHDFTIQNPDINATVFNPGDFMLFKCRQYTNNPYGTNVNANLEFTLRNSAGAIIQQLGTSTSNLGGGSESKYANISMDFPLTLSAGNYQVCAEANYDRQVSESNTSNNLFCYNITANGCPTCTYTLNSNTMTFQSGGGSGNFAITTNICCSWTAVSNASWITVTNGDFLGNGTVFYTVEPCTNNGTRSGTITVAGLTFTITQNCSQACNLSQSFEWGAQAGSSTLSDAAADLAIDASNNLYMTGDIQGSANFGNGIVLTTPSNAPDIFVSKHNASGQIQWAQRYGNTTQEEGTAITVDNQGNIYVAGYFSSTITFGSTTLTVNNTNEYAAFIIKLNSSGVIQWAKKINNQFHGSVSDIKIDNNNIIYVLGNVTNYQNGNNSFFISKYNNLGTQLTYNLFGSSANLLNTYGFTLDNTNNIIIAGRFMGSLTLGSNTINAFNTIDIDGFISKIDASNNILWLKKLTCPKQSQDAFTSVVSDGSNNIYALGYADSTVMLDNIILPGKGDNKLVIAKYSPTGNIIWAKSSLSQFQITTNIAKGNEGDIYITGYHSGDTLKLDNKAIISNGSNDGFVSRIDTNGIVKWLKTIGGSLADEAFGLAVNSNNDVYVAGGFRGVVAYGSTTLTSNGSTDIFLAKFKQCDLPIANITYTGTATICNNQSKLLTTPYCSTNTFQWYLNGNAIVNANNATYNATQAGTYTVKASAFAGCETTSNSVVISVSSNPNPVISGNNYICSGTSLQLDAGSGYISYLWSNGATTRQINISNPGTYSVTVKNASNCSATTYKTITLRFTPTASIAHTNIGNNYSFYSNAIGDSIQYSWNFGDGTTSNQANPVHNYLTNGTYIITLSVTNSCGNNLYQSTINLATSISNNISNISNIKLYPNPNRGQFILEIDSKRVGNGNINIYNTIGEKVWTKDVEISNNRSKINIDLSNLSNGVYHINLMFDNEYYNNQVIKIE